MLRDAMWFFSGDEGWSSDRSGWVGLVLIRFLRLPFAAYLTFRYLRVIERGKLSILYFFCPSCLKGPTDFCSPFRKRVDVCGACTVVCWSWRGVEAFLV